MLQGAHFVAKWCRSFIRPESLKHQSTNIGWISKWTCSARIPRNQKIMFAFGKGYHWDQRFKEMMREVGWVHCSDTFQSIYFTKDTGLLLTLYVDDMVLSGPADQHKPFWDKVKKRIEIEDPTPVDRILGRNHKLIQTEHGTAMQFSMEDCAENACKAYEELSGCTLKTASTPFRRFIGRQWLRNAWSDGRRRIKNTDEDFLECETG